jgi:hypothetical protein
MCVCTQDRTRYCGGSTHKHSIHTALLDHHRRAECNRRPCSMRVVRLKATYFSLNAQESHAHPPAFPFFLVTSCSSPSQQALPCTPTQKEISQTLHLGERACAHLLPCSPYPGLSAREVPTECTGQKSRSAIPSAAPWDRPPCTPRAHAHNKVDARTHTRSCFVGTWQHHKPDNERDNPCTRAASWGSIFRAGVLAGSGDHDSHDVSVTQVWCEGD